MGAEFEVCELKTVEEEARAFTLPRGMPRALLQFKLITLRH